MTEKVKLTQEQMEELESQKSEYVTSDIVINRINSRWNNEVFKSISIDDLIKALYIGYEVEPKYNVGDWVVSEAMFNKIYQLDFRGERNLNENPGRYRHVRHATPEEIAEEKKKRWWQEHGRGVWELKKGDLIQGTFGQVREVYRVNEVGEYATLPNYASYSKKDLAEWKIICFAEDRKDLEESE